MNFVILNSSNPNVFISQTTDMKIQNFKALPDGWHFGKGIAPKEDTITSSIKINNQAVLLGFGTDAFPGVDGEIQVNCYYGDETVELTIEPNGNISLIHDKNNVEINSIESLQLDGVFDFLKSNGKDIWNLSDSSTQITMTSTEKDLSAWRSKTPLVAAEYQLF